MTELDYFSKSLQRWYHENKCELPWRNTRDPYKIWLSEIILQQTQVAQGLPYFEKFERKYPNVSELANAEEDQILRDWQGLGYYSRARNLHSAAKQIHNELKGQFPDNYKEILKLKGIGPYTAAAISSFAFGEAKAVVDGNVIRVISRFFGIKEAVNEAKIRNKIQSLADEFIDTENPDTHNQAIMELGAMVCKPSSPDCNNCPFNEGCIAFKEKIQADIPFKNSKTKVRERFLAFFLVKKKDEIILRKRPSEGIWANLYDLPPIELDKKVEAHDILDLKEVKKLVDQSFQIEVIEGWQKHLLSHQRIWAKFLVLHLEDELPAELPDSFTGARFYSIDESRHLGKPILIVNFLNQYIY